LRKDERGEKENLVRSPRNPNDSVHIAFKTAACAEGAIPKQYGWFWLGSRPLVDDATQSSENNRKWALKAS